MLDQWGNLNKWILSRGASQSLWRSGRGRGWVREAVLRVVWFQPGIWSSELLDRLDQKRIGLVRCSYPQEGFQGSGGTLIAPYRFGCSGPRDELLPPPRCSIDRSSFQDRIYHQLSTSIEVLREQRDFNCQTCPSTR